MWQCHEGGIFAKVEKMVGRGGEQMRDTKTNKMMSALKYRCQIEAVVTRTRHNETNFNDEMSDSISKMSIVCGRLSQVPQTHRQKSVGTFPSYVISVQSSYKFE